MELTDLLGALVEHNTTGKGYQIQFNSGNLDKEANKSTDVEFGDLFFTNCSILNSSVLRYGILNKSTLCFDNTNRKPIAQKEDGTNLYPMEINSHMFLDISKIEAIEDVKDFDDWFEFPSSRVINIYMLPEDNHMNGNRNVVTIGFMA